MGTMPACAGPARLLQLTISLISRRNHMSVDAAVDRVRSNLKQDFFDWDVTEKELKDNNQALKEL